MWILERAVKSPFVSPGALTASEQGELRVWCGVVVLGVVNLPAGNWGLSASEHIIANLYHHGVLGAV